MSLIKVVCTYCDTILEEESALRASICPRCGRPYLLEEAARFYKHHDFEIENGELVRYYGTQSEVELPAFVVSIGEDAFFGNGTLKRIVIPEGVLRIGRNAFAGSALERVELPDSLDSIGDGAFSECANLTDVTIPWRRLYIGEDAFSNCTALSSVTTNRYPEPGAEDDDGGDVSSTAALTDSGSLDDLCAQYPDPDLSAEPDSAATDGGDELQQADLIAMLADSSSRYMAVLGELVDISSAVNSMTIVSAEIGARAFAGCTALKSVCITSGEIGDNAFAGCTALTRVYIPTGEIGKDVFAGCNSLEDIILPK